MAGSPAAARHRGRPDRPRHPPRGDRAVRPDQRTSSTTRSRRTGPARPLAADVAPVARRRVRVLRRHRYALRRDPGADPAPGGPARRRPRSRVRRPEHARVGRELRCRSSSSARLADLDRHDGRVPARRAVLVGVFGIASILSARPAPPRRSGAAGRRQEPTTRSSSRRWVAELPEGCLDENGDERPDAMGADAAPRGEPVARPPARPRSPARARRASGDHDRRSGDDRAAIPRPAARGLTWPRVAVVFTGGTISMRHDPAPAATSRPSPARISSPSVPGIDDVADVVPSTAAGRPPATSRSPRCSSSRSALDGALARIRRRRRRRRPGHRHDRGDRVLLRPPPRRRRSRSSSPARCGPPASPATTARRNLPTRSAWPRRRDVAPRRPGAVVVLAGTVEPADDVTKTHTLVVRHVPEPEPSGRSAGSTASRVILDREPAARAGT